MEVSKKTLAIAAVALFLAACSPKEDKAAMEQEAAPAADTAQSTEQAPAAAEQAPAADASQTTEQAPADTTQATEQEAPADDKAMEKTTTN